MTRTPGHDIVSPRITGFVSGHRNVLRLVAVGFGLLVLWLLNHPGPWAVIVMALIVLVLLAAIEILGRGARTGAPVDEAS